jgi:hypothetical protein
MKNPIAGESAVGCFRIHPFMPSACPLPQKKYKFHNIIQLSPIEAWEKDSIKDFRSPDHDMFGVQKLSVTFARKGNGAPRDTIDALL